MKIAVLSNVNLDMLTTDHELFKAEGYGQWISYALTPNQNLTEFNPKLIFLIIEGTALLETCRTYEEGVREINACNSYIEAMIKNYPNSRIVVSDIEVRNNRIDNSNACLWEAEWNRMLSGTKNALKIDIRGKLQYSDKMWYMGSIPYSMKSFTTLKNEISEFVRRYENVRKKVLVCDLDNTLWGGVVGEEGPLGITLSESLLGACYRDTQKRIRELADTGVLLAIVSKNNIAEVDEVFEKNTHMILKKDDFVSIKCNWEPKSKNIRDMAKELNLGIDSFVFLDDNEVEREEVRINAPGVEIIDFPKDVADLPNTILKAYNDYFYSFNQTEEDKKKLEQYRQEALRKEELTNAGSLEDYLKSLNIKIVLNEVKDTQRERTVQLINKTNQFNTNTHRFDEQQFSEYAGTTYVANVSDKYGDSGLVVILMVSKEGDTASIDNFIMSCRVMGRQIENAVCKAVADKLAEAGVKKLKASYIKTAKNEPVRELYERLGFELINGSDEIKEYEYKLPMKKEALLEVEWG